MTTIAEKTLYKNHGPQIGYWTIKVLAESEESTGPATELITYAKSMDGSPVTKESEIVGLNIGKSNETTPVQQALSEMQSRINKQLDRGYVHTLAEADKPVTNTLGKKKPMLATDIDKVKPESIDWANAFLQPKLDGNRCLSDDGIYSRGGKPFNLPHIEQAISDMGLAGVHLDGELYIHGVNLQQIGSLIKKPREESLALEYHVYDVVGSESFEQRFTALCKSNWNRSLAVKLVETHRVHNMEQARALHRKFVEQGYEGSILRHDILGYADDKRSRNVLKLKDFQDSEYPVVGYELGTPSVVGDQVYQAPTFIYEVKEGVTAKVVAMGTREEKHEEFLALERGENTDRRLLTIEHFGFTPDGIPNIATAKCWYEPL